MKWAVAHSAMQEARWAGLYGDLNARILRMAKRSVPVPGDKSKRRFLNWELRLKESTVTGIARLD